MSENRPKKIRLDQLMVERRIVNSREKAKAMIMAGQVVVNDHTIDKAGQKVADDAELRLKGDPCPYVSRGGLKLEGALDHFGIDVEGFVTLDIGASTGGFTDCLLSRGATRAYTIDVGSNQLDWRLRSDARVVCREGFHVKHLTRETIDAPFVDLIVADVSFISLSHILDPVQPFLEEGSRLLAMVKPQFELGPGKVGKGGVVRDEALRAEAVQRIAALLADRGFPPEPPCPAPIKGPKGNQEFFLFWPGLKQA